MKYTATYMSQVGLIVRPEVSYVSDSETIFQAEQAHQESKEVYEHEGFRWDDEALGWYISNTTLMMRYPDGDIYSRAAWAESLS
jgi:hypothetical protein